MAPSRWVECLKSSTLLVAWAETMFRWSWWWCWRLPWSGWTLCSRWPHPLLLSRLSEIRFYIFCFSGRQTSRPVSGENLLRGNIKTDCPEVHFLVGVNTRQDEEYPGSLGASSSQPAQTEDDRPLILLNHLNKYLSANFHTLFSVWRADTFDVPVVSH